MTYKKITVATGQVSGTQSNFPVLINPTLMSGWGVITLAEAQSLRFYSDISLTTQLPREVVSATEIYVKITSLTDTTIIYCSYDGTRADYGATDPYGRNAVWSGYNTVYHMSNVNDATASGQTLTNNNTTPFSSAKISNGSGVYGGTKNLSRSAVTTIGTGEFSYTGWFMATTITAGSNKVIFSHTGDVNTLLIDSLNKISWYSGGYRITGSTTLVANTWYHYALIGNGGADGSRNVKLYINGVQEGTTYTANYSLSLTDVRYGLNINGSSEPFDFGYLDEARKNLTTALSADWLISEYNNQNNVDTFWADVVDIGSPFTNPANIYASDDTYATITTAETTVYVSVSQDGGDTFSTELSQTLTSTDTVVSFGTTPASEVWGLNWTRADLVDSLFRIKIRIGSNIQIYKNFGFTTSTQVVYGIEIKIEGKATGGTVSLDYLEVKVHYGNSLIPIVSGMQIFVTDGRKAGEGVGAGTGVLAFYDGTDWIAVDSGLTVDD